MDPRQRAVVNELPQPSYDESSVPPYTLPDPLRLESGEAVRGPEDFLRRRRPELLELFTRYVYGRVEGTLSLDASWRKPLTPFGNGLGSRGELAVVLQSPNGRSLELSVLVHVPPASTPRPAFLGLNLFGNHTLHPDPWISLPRGWLPENAALGLQGHTVTDASRGMHSGRWPVELVLSRGYALVTAYAGDIDPDFDDGFENGLHGLLPRAERRADDAPGTIAAWAYGMSRMLDALSLVPSIDGARVAAIGHSRLGKAALWAAARDPRFAMAISNQSGCGGAALSRRRFGERLVHINRRFPHWFCRAFHGYDEREHELPVDQHQLLALLAPRPVYVGSAAADSWADPRGERLACEAASLVFELFGKRGLPRPSDAPTTVAGPRHVGYHVRPGGHDITPRDFWHYLDFADAHGDP
jgi:hypothetical protein